MNYAETYNPSKTPQSEKAKSGQVENNAGGYVFKLDKWKRLERFLILGSDTPTYYQSAPGLTRENGKVVVECFDESAFGTITLIKDISISGRAARNDPAIFALALGAVHSDVEVRRQSLGAMSSVCRTGTHLFQFVDFATKLGKGWGRAMKRAVADWYDGKDEDKLAYQLIKYRSRHGFTHNRLLNLAHPNVHGDLYKWVVGRQGVEHPLIRAHEAAMAANSVGSLLDILRKHKLPWEALPTEFLNSSEVYQHLVPDMGLTALIRNLGKMSSIGALKPMGKTVDTVVEKLGDADLIKKSRLHPFAVLHAMSTYGSGQGFRGSLSWDVDRSIMDALDGAFYKAFKNVTPTGKRHLLALDVSGSMSQHMMNSNISCYQGVAAMSLVTMAAEKNTHTVAFSSSTGGSWSMRGSKCVPLDISPRQRLDDVVNSMCGLPFGGTDCALPMLYALEQGIEVDVFVIYTDNETWAGNIHPYQALDQYRTKTGINAKLIVVGMTSTGFTIADSSDGGMLDVVGFDTSAPAIMSDFVRG